MLIVERVGSSLLERDEVLKSTQSLPLLGMCCLRFVYHWHKVCFKQSRAKIIIPNLPGSHGDPSRGKVSSKIKTKHG